MTKNINLYRNLLSENGYIHIRNFFSNSQRDKLLKYFDEIENLKEEKYKYMIYYENDNKKSRIEYFYKYHRDLRKFIKNDINPFLNTLLKSEQVLFKDKMNWKYPNGNSFNAHQDHLAWNDFNLSIFHSVALFGNLSNEENGCLQFSNHNNRVILPQNNNLEISKNIDEKLEWNFVETNPNDIVIFNSFVPHKSNKNNSSKSRRIMYLTYNILNEGNYYEEYNKNKRKYFPPENERTEDNEIDKNNKYNLANPLV